MQSANHNAKFVLLQWTI